MRLSLLLLCCLIFSRCQVVYTRANTATDNTDYNYLYGELEGNWNKTNTDYYITFEFNSKYIASIKIDTRYEHGFVIRSTGFYYLQHDTLFLEDDATGIATMYICHAFDDCIVIEPLSNQTINRFRGIWISVPYIPEPGLYPLPRPLPPLRPVNPDPIPEKPVVQKDDTHKKRPDGPIVQRPQRPINEKPVKEPEVQRPKRPEREEPVENPKPKNDKTKPVKKEM